jgi:hypothetical protein
VEPVCNLRLLEVHNFMALAAAADQLLHTQPLEVVELAVMAAVKAMVQQVPLIPEAEAGVVERAIETVALAAPE